MKKIILTSLFIMIFPGLSFGAGYVLANIGVGGEVDSPSYGLELGAVFLSPYHPTGGAYSVGLGISIADSDDDPPDAPAKEYNDGSEQEVCAVFGAEISPAFFGVAGVGYASQDIVKPGTTSERETDTETHVSWMLGARYVVEWFDFGVGYHSRRGVMASLGVAF